MAKFVRRCAGCLLAVALVAPAVALGQGFVQLGPADTLALSGQPLVQVAVYPAAGSPPNASFGPSPGLNSALLDTAANGLILVGPGVEELELAGYQTVATYNESGVAGTSSFDVSAAYRLDVAGSNGVPFSLNDSRIMSDPTLNLGTFGGVIGMPSMIGRSVSIDFEAFADPNQRVQNVSFPVMPVADAAHRYVAPLTMVNFPQSGQVNPTDPLPSWAPLPSMQIDVAKGAALVNTSFLLDTGAQITMINRATAFALGLDADNSGEFDGNEVLPFTIPIGGIGGSIEAPFVVLDRLAVKTAEGIDLVFTNLEVAVFDIDPAINGIFGMNLLTTGWFATSLGFSDETGFFTGMHLDFTGGATGQNYLLLDVNPDLDVVQVPEPSTLVLAALAALAGIGSLSRKRRLAA